MKNIRVATDLKVNAMIFFGHDTVHKLRFLKIVVKNIKFAILTIFLMFIFERTQAKEGQSFNHFLMFALLSVLKKFLTFLYF